MAKASRKKARATAPRAATLRSKHAQSKAAAASSTPADDDPIIALDLPAAALTPAMRAYFAKCEQKLGFVPHVLSAYAFDMHRSLKRSSPCTTT